MDNIGHIDYTEFIPEEINLKVLTQSDFPRIAKNKKLMEKITASIKHIPTKQIIVHDDSRNMNLSETPIHLIITSPPYWILKRYDPIKGQLGTIEDYEQFLIELDKVWKQCYNALVPGGRMVAIVGDVCLSRRKYNRHRTMPLHSSIQEHCRRIGFDNLTPIIWYKITNITLEVELLNYNSGGKMMVTILADLVYNLKIFFLDEPTKRARFIYRISASPPQACAGT